MFMLAWSVYIVHFGEFYKFCVSQIFLKCKCYLFLIFQDACFCMTPMFHFSVECCYLMFFLIFFNAAFVGVQIIFFCMFINKSEI